jgi:two-component system, NtrC family, nitrogen regulation sensor histidine kinase NtrY
MRLRGRFTLWFALAALVPIAVAALVTRDVVSRGYTNEFERARLATERSLKRELDRLESSVEGVVADMVAPDRRHPLVGGVILELQKSGGALPSQSRRNINKHGYDYKRGLGLDVLFVVDSSDEVLVAPHYRPAHDTTDPTPRRRARATLGRAFYVREPIMQGDQIVPLLVVESAREHHEGRYSVVVAGGRAVDRELLESIRQLDRIDARIVDDQGRVLVAPQKPWDADSAYLISVPLSGPEGAPVAMIEVAISRADLERVLMQVTVAALVLALAALLVTILLGAFVARRMTANLDRLVEGAQAASRGDLDHRVAIASKDEIGAVARSFNAMMEDLKTSKERLVIAERIAAWQEIARRLAHEIKNPLTPIQMSVETMRKTWKKKHPSFEEVFEESTATVLEETARLKRIVSEFAEFARMPKPLLIQCDLGEVVAGCLALYQGTIPITRKLARNLPPVRADRDQLAQVLLNLVENARDALASRPENSSDSDSGRIVVETRLSKRGDRVELIVEDNGPGLSEQVKDRLFTPYFTTKEGGTGLGLAIAHRMISDHGGRITAGDSAEGGARFLVQLPVDRQAARDPGE